MRLYCYLDAVQVVLAFQEGQRVRYAVNQDVRILSYARSGCRPVQSDDSRFIRAERSFRDQKKGVTGGAFVATGVNISGSCNCDQRDKNEKR